MANALADPWRGTTRPLAALDLALLGRLVTSANRLRDLDEAAGEERAIRDRLVVEAVEAGVSRARVADAIGVSAPLVAKILTQH